MLSSCFFFCFRQDAEERDKRKRYTKDHLRVWSGADTHPLGGTRPRLRTTSSHNQPRASPPLVHSLPPSATVPGGLVRVVQLVSVLTAAETFVLKSSVNAELVMLREDGRSE